VPAPCWVWMASCVYTTNKMYIKENVYSNGKKNHCRRQSPPPSLPSSTQGESGFGRA
jgi:hypothetical protein